MENTYFTDTEYRVLLAALCKERIICKKVDDVFDGEPKLQNIMNSIERKIEHVQYSYSDARNTAHDNNSDNGTVITEEECENLNKNIPFPECLDKVIFREYIQACKFAIVKSLKVTIEHLDNGHYYYLAN